MDGGRERQTTKDKGMKKEKGFEGWEKKGWRKIGGIKGWNDIHGKLYNSLVTVVPWDTLGLI